MKSSPEALSDDLKGSSTIFDEASPGRIEVLFSTPSSPKFLDTAKALCLLRYVQKNGDLFGPFVFGLNEIHPCQYHVTAQRYDM